MLTKTTIDYCNKLILAPMVRGSRLPMRMLALRYGADLVYTDENIDHSFLLSKRRFNDALGTFDYVNDANGYVLFRTDPIEKDRLVFQMATACPERAVRLAKLVENDVSAIDVNMGCPLPFSTAGGMGAALLTRPEQSKSILKALVDSSKLPVTCKIRIFDNIEETIKLVKELETTGISAIAVHGRTKKQKHMDPVNIEGIRTVVENASIPVIANGGSTDMNTHEDVLKFREHCGATSVMVARAAQTNVSIFSPKGLTPQLGLLTEYLKLCVDYDNPIINTKYSMQIIHRPLGRIQRTKFGRQYEDAQSLAEICDLFNLQDYAREKYEFFRSKGLVTLPDSPLTNFNMMSEEILELRKNILNDQDVIYCYMKYKRNYFNFDELPKVILHGFAGRRQIPLPTYETKRMERLYYSVITFDGKKYASLVWERLPKHAEQNAALVCAYYLGLYDEEYLQAIGLLFK